MSTVDEKVLAEFLKQMDDADEVPDVVAAALRTSLSKEKLPKPEHLVELFSTSTGDALT
jgi:hypothetical protein